MVGQCRAWNAIMVLGQPHARKTSGVGDIEIQCREWHVFITVGQHPLLDDIGCGMIA